MLKLVLEVPQPPSADRLQEAQLIPNLFQGWVPLKTSILIGDKNLRTRFLPRPNRRNKLPNELVGDQTNDNRHRNRDGSEDEGVTPLRTIETAHRKGLSTNEDDHDLARYNNELNADKPSVPQDPLEYIEIVVKTTAAAQSQDHAENIESVFRGTYLY